MSTVSVAFVDDHPAMLVGVSALFSDIPNSRVSGTGSSAQDIIDLAIHQHPDIIIADLCMPGNVFDAIAVVSKVAPKTKIVIFTAAVEVEAAVRALGAGASAYVLKGSKINDLVRAVNSVQAGEMYITEGFAAKVVAALSSKATRPLNPTIKFNIREEQIVGLLLRGKTNKEIATALNLSHKTVKHYMTLLMQKLQVRNRLEVALAAKRLQEDVSSGPKAAMISSNAIGSFPN